MQEGAPVEEGRWREEIRDPRGGRRERCGGNDTLPRVLGRPRGGLFFSDGGERVVGEQRGQHASAAFDLASLKEYPTRAKLISSKNKNNVVFLFAPPYDRGRPFGEAE